jgi:hypothetical protein
LQNLLEQNEILTVDAKGQIPATMVPATSAKIFIPQSEIHPLDPVVTSILPAHDVRDILPTTPITIHFSEPMDVDSVQRAFSTTPQMSGAFSWSAVHDDMTFTPAGHGFPTQTLVTIRIGDSAFAMASKKTFYAGFEARFRSGNEKP